MTTAAKRPATPSLGQFLRARREQLRPEDFGLPPGQRRRAPGLRREEAAALCGISPTWFTWIEQGRTQSVSVDTLGAIAAGLRLSQAERGYLFQLATRADPQPPTASDERPALQALVQAVRTPAYVLDRHWDAVAWNRPAAQLFDAWLGRGGGGNLLRYVFTDAHAQAFIAGWAERAERLVAEYRADTAAWHDDPVRQALVDELCRASSAFRSAWKAQRVLSREGGWRRFEHERRGALAFQQFTLKVAHQPELKLTVLVPAG
ncbi:helix-turn-helix transcriptional regulator [Sphaerotilaceae bacterium SBD11-9]